MPRPGTTSRTSEAAMARPSPTATTACRVAVSMTRRIRQPRPAMREHVRGTAHIPSPADRTISRGSSGTSSGVSARVAGASPGVSCRRTARGARVDRDRPLSPSRSAHSASVTPRSCRSSSRPPAKASSAPSRRYRSWWNTGSAAVVLGHEREARAVDHLAHAEAHREPLGELGLARSRANRSARCGHPGAPPPRATPRTRGWPAALVVRTRSSGGASVRASDTASGYPRVADVAGPWSAQSLEVREAHHPAARRRLGGAGRHDIARGLVASAGSSDRHPRGPPGDPWHPRRRPP